MKISKEQQGFTLVELMIVIAIMGILAAVAMSQFGDYITKQRQATARSFITQISSLEKTYFAEYYKYWPTGNDTVQLMKDGASTGPNRLNWYPNDAPADVFYDIWLGATDSGEGERKYNFVVVAKDRPTYPVKKLPPVVQAKRDIWAGDSKCMCNRADIKTITPENPAGVNHCTRRCSDHTGSWSGINNEYPSD